MVGVSTNAKFAFRILLYGIIWIVALHRCHAALTVSMSRRSNYASDNGLSLVTFCVECEDPFHEGSASKGLHPKHGLQDFRVTGTLIYCVPNNAESRKVLNAHHFKDRIVLINRGNMGLLDKVSKIQDSEAVGIIIADDGRCRDDFSYCGPQAGSAKEGGFAINDDLHRWREIEIPVVLVSMQTAEALRQGMGVRQVQIPKLGYQNITVFHHGKEQYRDELRF